MLWTSPPHGNQKTPRQETALPLEQARDKLSKLLLVDAVDIALRNNPAARVAWADSRAAAARYGSSLGDWFPTINLNGSLTRAKGGSNYTGVQTNSAITTYNAAATLSYLLFDFGGRSALIEESRQSLIAANWTQNAVIRNAVLQVELAFFNYTRAKALLEANRTSLIEAEINMSVAEERHRVGLATSADVLQAKTAFSETQLAFQSTEGQVRIAKAALAVALGYPANIPYEIDAIVPGTPTGELTVTVDRLIDQALVNRPDVQASKALTLQLDARVREMRSKILPSFSIVGSIGRAWLDGVSGYKDTYGGSLSIQVPLFSGFSSQYDILAAKAGADAARERERGFKQTVTFQVFASHSHFITAGERLKTSEDFFNSAKQSEEVALGRYKEGVGSILDLLSAQRTLATARAEQINARLNWFESLAQLAHDVGILDVNGDNPLIPQNLSQEVKK